MKSIFKTLWALLAAVTLVGCHGISDETPEPGEQQLAPGVVRISANKSKIEANGADQVTFTVVLGTEEGNRVVSDGQSNLTIHYEKNGTMKGSMARFSNTFSTTAPGTYTFKAELYEAGTTYYSENTVTVEAISTAGSGVQYYQKLMGVQFTSVGCVYCPQLSTAIKQIQSEQPGRLLPVSFHLDMNYPGEDPMTTPTSTTFMNHFGRQGLPQFYLNMRKGETKITNEYSLIVEEMEKMLANYPTTCGVAIESSYDPSTRKVNITGKVTSNTSLKYRYMVMLVEDGIVAQQSGEANYVHNNVMRRAWPSDGVMGYHLISDGSATTPGVEVEVVRPEFELDRSWNADNVRVFFAVMSSQDGGMSYTVDNCNECKLGESVDYAIEEGGQTPGPVPSGKKPFQRHVTLYEFTGVGCAMCPDGFSTLNGLINNPYGGYKETVHMLAFHSNSMGDDPMHLNLTTQLLAEYGNMGLPSVLVDLKERGEISTIKADLTTWWDESLEEMPAHCGAALSTTYDSASRTGKLTLKVGINEPSTYRVALFLVEDGVQWKQNNSGTYVEPYNHRHVVREMLSAHYTGDLVGKDLQEGDERTLEYDFTIDPNWDETKMQLYAVLIDDATGYAKNLAYVNLGESADYDLYE